MAAWTGVCGSETLRAAVTVSSGACTDFGGGVRTAWHIARIRLLHVPSPSTLFLLLRGLVVHMPCPRAEA